MAENIHPQQEAFVIRLASPKDRAQIDALLESGLLPGHVNYEAQRADRIRRSLGSDRERFLVAQAGDRVIGTIAVIEAQRDVGHLHWLRVDPAWAGDLRVARALVAAAAEHARTVGLLKLAMHAPAAVVEVVADFYRDLGFLFSRTREVDGLHVLEFYLNLYEKPRTTDAPDAPDAGS